jgi:hypothetical protein
MSKLPPAARKWIGLAVLLAALGLVWLGVRNGMRPTGGAADAPVAGSREPVLRPPPADLPPPPPPGVVPQPPPGMRSVGVPPGAMPEPAPGPPARDIDLPTLRAEVARLREALAASKDPGVLRGLIKEFGDLIDDAIASLGPEAVAQELVQTLTTDFVDVEFGLEFGPGPDGRMETVPNWRSLLLDGLAATASPLAADFARASVLDQQRTPADWAMGIKILWQANGRNPDDPYLQSKVREMFANTDWTAQPTDALLESCDYVVALHDRGMVPSMVDFLQGDVRSGTPFASAIVLQRMAGGDAQVVADVLSSMDGPIADPDIARSRASVVARTDPRDPAAAALVRQYLTQSGATSAEIDYFIRSYPGVDAFVTQNLASAQPPPDRSDLARRQLAALELLRSLAQDPALATHQKAFGESLERLGHLVDEARSAGAL